MRVVTVSSHTIESTRSYLGEKIRKPGPQNIFCGLRWTDLEVETILPSHFLACPNQKNAQGNKRKKRKRLNLVEDTAPPSLHHTIQKKCGGQ